MCLPRMTTRRWMIAVAVVGMALAGCVWVVRMRLLALEHRALAQRHAAQAANLRMGADMADLMAGNIGPKELEAFRERSREIARYHEAARQKYEHAARYP